MFKWKAADRKRKSVIPAEEFPFFGLEALEDRRLMSGSVGRGHSQSTIEFSQAPSAVQAGLDALAVKNSLAAPDATSTQTVLLKNSNGIESYTIDITGTGTDTKLTVDQNGNPVTAPTKSSTTFGAITSTAATNEITAIATALSLTAPTSTSTVSVVTNAAGVATYTIRLTSSTTGRHYRTTTVSVDSNGNPVGNQSLPFSVLPSAIQSDLNAKVPSGATPLDATSTQTVTVKTLNGVTSYSVTFTGSGTTTTVSVNSVGVLVTLPSTSAVNFSTIPQAAQTELQTLATADGVTTAIATTQTVSAYDEGNGTTIYTVKLPATATSSPFNISISVDQAGNPTVLPNQAGGSGNCGTFGGSGFAGSNLGGSGGSDFAGIVSSFFGGRHHRR